MNTRMKYFWTFNYRRNLPLRQDSIYQDHWYSRRMPSWVPRWSINIVRETTTEKDSSVFSSVSRSTLSLAMPVFSRLHFIRVDAFEKGMTTRNEGERDMDLCPGAGRKIVLSEKRTQSFLPLYLLQSSSEWLSCVRHDRWNRCHAFPDSYRS